MNELIKLHAQTDHVIQWNKLKRLYIQKRGSDRGQSHTKIPRTTNSDVAELTKWWHKEFHRGVMRAPWNGKREMTRWAQAKQTIERDLEGSDPAAVYPKNEWFWEDATRRISAHLYNLKSVPSATDLLFESFKETISERVNDVGALAKGAVSAVNDAADAVTGAGKQAVSMLKTGAIIAASVLGAAIVLPPVIRAMRKD